MNKKDWKYKKLGAICSVINGLWKGKKPPFINVGVFRNANFTKDFTLRYDNIEYLDVEIRQFNTRKLQKGDLIVEKSGGSEKQPVGRAVLFDLDDGNYSFSNFTSVLRINIGEKLLPKYLYYFLLFVYKRGDTLKMQTAATGIHNIIFDSYLGMSVPVPPLSEQEEIVKKLDAAFAEIDALKANSESQLLEARALFQATLSNELSPKNNWQKKTLKEIGKTQTGTTPSMKNQSNYGDYIPFIRPSEIDFDGCGGIKYDSEVKLSETGVKNGRLFKQNSIFMVCIGTVGKIGYSIIDVSCNQQINVLTPNEKFNYKFLYYAMRNKNFNDLVIKIAKSAQATLPIINKTKWENLSIFVPSLSAQEEIVARLDALSENVRKLEEINRRTIAECDALRQSILRQIFD